MRIADLGSICSSSENIKWKDVPRDKAYKYIDLTSVDRDTKSIIEPQSITADTAPSRAQRIIRQGDILFATTRPTLRRLCVVPPDYDGEICSTGFCVLRPDLSKVLPKWVFILLSTDAFYDYIGPLQTGATYPAVTDKDVRAFAVPVPSLPEQQRIVDILDQEFAKIDALKANAEKSLQASKDLFQAVLLQELENAPGARQVELNEITEICLGLTHTPKYVENGVPFVSVKDISGGELDLSSTKRISEIEFRDFPYGAKPKKGDVLFCRVGTIGKPMILEEDTPFGIFVSVGFFRPYKEKVLNSFLKYWMLSSIFERQVETNVVGSTLKNLNTGWLKHFSVPLPPLEQQRQLVKRLDILYRKNSTLQGNYQKSLALCDDLKQSLLRKAFNGEMS